MRVNLKGREPFGRISRADFERECTRLSEFLFALTCPQTGLPIVRNVYHPTRDLQGDRLDSMPDLLIEWNREAPFYSIQTPGGDVLEDVQSWGRSGDHTPNNLLLIKSSGDRGIADSAQLIDIAPTILDLLGHANAALPGRSLLGV